MFIINAEIRKECGKRASRRLRAINKFPAIIYSSQAESLPIELDHEKIWNMQNQSEFYKEIITIVINDRRETVKIHSVQRHAFKPKLIHIDFIRSQTSKS